MWLDGTSSLPGAVGQAHLHPWGPLGGCLVTVHRITMSPWRPGVILLLVMRGQSADTQGDAVVTSEAGGRWGLWAQLTARTCPRHPPLHLPLPTPPAASSAHCDFSPKKNSPWAAMAREISIVHATRREMLGKTFSCLSKKSLCKQVNQPVQGWLCHGWASSWAPSLQVQLGGHSAVEMVICHNHFTSAPLTAHLTALEACGMGWSSRDCPQETSPEPRHPVPTLRQHICWNEGAEHHLGEHMQLLSTW